MNVDTLVDARLLPEDCGLSIPETESEEVASVVGAARLEDEMARVAKMIEELEGIFIVIYDDQQDIAMTRGGRLG